MFIWISRLALVALVAGCGLRPGTDTDVVPTRQTVVADGFAVVGPDGYCPEERLSRDGADGAFVVLTACPGVNVPMVLTALVAPGGGVSVDDAAADLAAFFQTEPGRTALSRGQDPRTVTILDTRTGDGALRLKLRDTAPDVIEGTSEIYWRLIFDVGGRLVTLTATPREGTEQTDPQILQALADFRTGFLAANA